MLRISLKKCTKHLEHLNDRQIALQTQRDMLLEFSAKVQKKIDDFQEKTSYSKMLLEFTAIEEDIDQASMERIQLIQELEFVTEGSYRLLEEEQIEGNEEISEKELKIEELTTELDMLFKLANHFETQLQSIDAEEFFSDEKTLSKMNEELDFLHDELDVLGEKQEEMQKIVNNLEEKLKQRQTSCYGRILSTIAEEGTQKDDENNDLEFDSETCSETDSQDNEETTIENDGKPSPDVEEPQPHHEYNDVNKSQESSNEYNEPESPNFQSPSSEDSKNPESPASDHSKNPESPSSDDPKKPESPASDDSNHSESPNAPKSPDESQQSTESRGSEPKQYVGQQSNFAAQYDASNEYGDSTINTRLIIVIISLAVTVPVVICTWWYFRASRTV